MLTVPEGVSARVHCCRVGLAVSFPATEGASCSCSVCGLFEIPQFDVWLPIVRGTTSYC